MAKNVKKFEAVLSEHATSLWGHHFIVPEAVSKFYKHKKIKRLICTLNETHQFHCAMTSKGEGVYFIILNAEIRKKHKLKVGDSFKIILQEDDSKYGMPMPEEFDELLKQDPEGYAIFQELTPGKQRTLIYIVLKPKSSEVRLRKALTIVNHLKLNGGHIDFKQLNEEMKLKK